MLDAHSAFHVLDGEWVSAASARSVRLSLELLLDVLAQRVRPFPPHGVVSLML